MTLVDGIVDDSMVFMDILGPCETRGGAEYILIGGSRNKGDVRYHWDSGAVGAIEF